MLEEEKETLVLVGKTTESFLDFVILHLLKKDTFVFYDDLTKSVIQKLKTALSPRILAVHLLWLEQKGLACSGNLKGRRFFEITERGRRRLIIARESWNSVLWVVEQLLESNPFSAKTAEYDANCTYAIEARR